MENVNSNETAATLFDRAKVQAAALIGSALLFFAGYYGMTTAALAVTAVGAPLALYALNNMPLRRITTLITIMALGSGSIFAILTAIRIVLRLIVIS